MNARIDKIQQNSECRCGYEANILKGKTKRTTTLIKKNLKSLYYRSSYRRISQLPYDVENDKHTDNRKNTLITGMAWNNHERNRIGAARKQGEDVTYYI